MHFTKKKKKTRSVAAWVDSSCGDTMNTAACPRCLQARANRAPNQPSADYSPPDTAAEMKPALFLLLALLVGAACAASAAAAEDSFSRALLASKK